MSLESKKNINKKQKCKAEVAQCGCYVPLLHIKSFSYRKQSYSCTIRLIRDIKKLNISQDAGLRQTFSLISLSVSLNLCKSILHHPVHLKIFVFFSFYIQSHYFTVL